MQIVSAVYQVFHVLYSFYESHLHQKHCVQVNVMHTNINILIPRKHWHVYYACITRDNLEYYTWYTRVYLNVRGYSFITYAQISGFQTHPPTLYAQIMTSLWQQCIGVGMALDPLPPFSAYVINEWPLITQWASRVRPMTHKCTPWPQVHPVIASALNDPHVNSVIISAPSDPHVHQMT